MEFEFDINKSKANLQKHGIDFIQTQRLWDDPDSLEIPAKTEGERRIFLIGKIADKMWTVIFTPRGQKTRVISVRCARKKEVDLYES